MNPTDAGSLLLVAETNGTEIAPSTAGLIAFAARYREITGRGATLLLAGSTGMAAAANAWATFGVDKVLLAEAGALEYPEAERLATVVIQAAKAAGAAIIVAPSGTFGRDLMPRAAALMDVPMLSDVLAIDIADGQVAYTRALFAGSLLTTVRIECEGAALTVRGAAFGKAEPNEKPCAVEALQLEHENTPPRVRLIQRETGSQTRPDLTTARVVVSGGRPLQNAETFEKLLGGLADKLGGAVGATRAAVDAGIAPNELQVGQTGKVVSPELYIAAGVSGSVQHLAGMKDSRTIVAINTDPDAPIFDVADYGLVQDLFTAIPELIQKLG